MTVDTRASARGFLRRMPRPFNILVAVVCTGVAALIAYPIGHTLFSVFFESGLPTLRPLRLVLRDAHNREAIKNTLIIAGSSTVLATVQAVVLAWINERTDAHLPAIGRVLPMLPLLVSPIAAAVAWVFLLSPGAGLLNGWLRDLGIGAGSSRGPLNILTMPGMIAMYSIYLVPFTFIPINNALVNIDPALEEASRNSGAGLLKTLRKVTLPAIKPAIYSGAILTAVIALALFSVPVILGPPAGVQVVSVRVYNMLTKEYPSQTSEAVALSVLMFVIVMIGLFVRSRVLRRGNFSVMSGRARSETRVSLGRWRWPARALVLGYIAATAIIPFLALLVVSLQPFWSAKLHLSKSTFVHYRETFFDNVNTQSALKNSILLALVGATITVLVLVLLGLFVHRNKRARGYIVDGVVKFPAAFPQLIMAIALLLAFGPKPFHLSGTLYLLLIGYFVVYVPYGSFIVGSGFTQLGTEFSEASSSCGASPGRTFRRIELPLVMPSVVSGWTLLFVFILSDVTVSSLLTTKNAPVVGFAIVDQYENGSYPTIAALGVVVSMTCALVVFGAQGLSYLRSSRKGTGESRAVLANQSTVMGR